VSNCWLFSLATRGVLRIFFRAGSIESPLLSMKFLQKNRLVFFRAASRRVPRLRNNFSKFDWFNWFLVKCVQTLEHITNVIDIAPVTACVGTGTCVLSCRSSVEMTFRHGELTFSDDLCAITGRDMYERRQSLSCCRAGHQRQWFVHHGDQTETRQQHNNWYPVRPRLASYYATRTSPRRRDTSAVER
jgi:hypothetical protein